MEIRKNDRELLKDVSTLSLSSIWSRNENSKPSSIQILESKYEIPYLPKNNKKDKNKLLQNQERESKRLEFLCTKNASNISLGSSRLSFDMAMATIPKLILRSAKELKIVEDVLKPYQDNALLAQYMIDKYITKDLSKIHDENKENNNEYDDIDDVDDNIDDDNNNDDEHNINNIFVTNKNDEDDLEAEFRYLETERAKIEKLVMTRIRKEKLAARLLMLQERSTYKNIENDDDDNDDDEYELDADENTDDLENQNDNGNDNTLDEIAEEELVQEQLDSYAPTKTEKDFKSKRDYIVYRKQILLTRREGSVYNSLIIKQKEIEERLLNLKQKFGEKARARTQKWMYVIFYLKYVKKISKRYQMVSTRHKIRMRYSRALAVVLRTYRNYKERIWKRENNITQEYEGTLFDKYRNDLKLRSRAKKILDERMEALSLISSFIRSLDSSLKHAIVKFLQRIRTLQFFIRSHQLGTEGRYLGFSHLFDLFFHRLQMMIFVHIESNDVYINAQKKKLLTKMKSHLAAPSKKPIIKQMKEKVFSEKLKNLVDGQDMAMILTLSFKFTDTIKKKYFIDYIFESRRKYVHKLEEDARKKITIQKLTTDEVKMWLKGKSCDPLEEHLNNFLDKADQGFGKDSSTVRIQPYISFLKNITASDLLDLFFEMFEEQRAIYKAQEMMMNARGTGVLSTKTSFLNNASSFLKSSFVTKESNNGSFSVKQPKEPLPSSHSPRKSFLSN